MIDRKTATRRLANRWNEQCEKFPRMREEIPLKAYVAANLQATMRLEDGLKEYDRA